LTPNTNTIARFSIAADAAGDVTWRKIGFVYATSTDLSITASSIYLYKTGNTTKLNASGASATVAGTLIAYTADAEQTVGKGTSQTYDLVADITGYAASRSIGVKISGTSATAGTSTSYATLITETMFWWADGSGTADNGTHTSASDDWCDSTYVKSLPTAYQTLVSGS
jgi:hypothetical protein